MTSLLNRIAVRAIPIIGTNTLMPKALAAGRAGSQTPAQGLAKRHKITSVNFEGMKVWHIHPKKGVTSDTVLYHIHGGGFVLGMPRIFYPIYAKLADMTGCRVIAPDYPLPPNATGAQIRAWSLAHYRFACEQYGADNIVLSGDSAGATLALWIAQNGGAAAHLMLWSPWADLTHTNPDQDEITTEPLIDMSTIRAAAARYAGDLALDDPDISPIFGEHSALPPVSIYSGSFDLFHPDILRLKAIMTSAGADVSLHTQAGCTHDYMYLPTPEAKATLRDMAGIIRAI